MMPYQLELSWPVIVTRMPAPMSDTEQLEYLDRVKREVLDVKREHVMLIVTESSIAWTAEQRKRHVAWQKMHQRDFTAYCKASALVMPQIPTLLRFALSAMFAVMGRGASPTQLFTHETEARLWASKHLSASAKAAPQR